MLGRSLSSKVSALELGGLLAGVTADPVVI